MGFRKHYYKQSWQRWWNSSRASSNPKRWCVKVLHSIHQQIWKTVAVATGPENISVHSNLKDKQCQRMFKLQLHSFHLLARLCSKSFQADFNSTWTKNFQMYKLDFEKAQEPKIKLSTYNWIIEKAREFMKNIYLYSLTTLKPFTVWITTNCRKVIKRWEYQTTLPVSWETCMQIKKKQLDLDME